MSKMHYFLVFSYLGTFYSTFYPKYVYANTLYIPFLDMILLIFLLYICVVGLIEIVGLEAGLQINYAHL